MSKKILLSLLPIVVVFGLHYVSTHLYAQICVPWGMEGFFLSILTTSSPICSGLLNTIVFSSHSYASLIAAGLSIFFAASSFPWYGLDEVDEVNVN